MHKSKKKRLLLAQIDREKSRLDDKELELLLQIRRRLDGTPQVLESIAKKSPDYSTLAEKEKRSNRSELRINHILLLEFELKILERTLSQRTLDFLRSNPMWLMAYACVGPLGKALGYYLKHREELEQAFSKVLGGLLYRQTTTIKQVSLLQVSAEDLLASRSLYDGICDVDWLEETINGTDLLTQAGE